METPVGPGLAADIDWRSTNCREGYDPTLPTPTHPTSRSTGLGVVTLTLNLFGWASVPLFIRHFADSLDAWTSNGWRYGFSALVWLPVLIVAILQRRAPRGLWRAALIPSIINAAGQVCFTWAHYRIDPALLTFGLRTQLLFVAVGAWILFPRERAIIRTPGYLLGAFALIVGSMAVLFLDHEKTNRETRPEFRSGEGALLGATDAAAPRTIGADSGDQAEAPPTTAHLAAMRHSATAHLEGVLLAVGSGLLFACYGLSVRKYMEGMSPVLSFAAICQFTAAAMVVLMVMFGDRAGRAALDLPGRQMSMLLLSALIGIAIGHVFYYISIARLGVALTAGVLQLQPFIVALFSLTLFGERLTSWQWVGGSVAVLGAMTMLGTQWRMSRAAPAKVAQAIEQPLAIAEGESGA